MNNNRPLSPHITVHKWMLTQIMSIMHRATAIGYSIGLLFVSLWLVSFSFGPKYFQIFQKIFNNIFGELILFLIAFCFIFYFIDEIRRLFWSLGFGVSLKMIKVTSYFVIFFSIFILISIFIFVL